METTPAVRGPHQPGISTYSVRSTCSAEHPARPPPLGSKQPAQPLTTPHVRPTLADLDPWCPRLVRPRRRTLVQPPPRGPGHAWIVCRGRGAAGYGTGTRLAMFFSGVIVLSLLVSGLLVSPCAAAPVSTQVLDGGSARAQGRRCQQWRRQAAGGDVRVIHVCWPRGKVRVSLVQHIDPNEASLAHSKEQEACSSGKGPQGLAAKTLPRGSKNSWPRPAQRGSLCRAEDPIPVHHPPALRNRRPAHPRGIIHRMSSVSVVVIGPRHTSRRVIR